MNAFPDLKPDVKIIYTAGDVIVAKFFCQATHKDQIIDFVL
jgi:predicted ester cyclase